MIVSQKFYIISLGCEKNRVDSEVMTGLLVNHGLTQCSSPEKSDIIIVNTCAFIGDAKKESIDTILEMAAYKNNKRRLLMVAGCLPERYRKELKELLPEVDGFIGVREFRNITEIINKIKTGKLDKYKKAFLAPIYSYDTPRIISTPRHYAYIKISDGCFRRCSFCIIPAIRGKQHSRPVHDIVKEVKHLSSIGVKEFNLLAQDLSAYGHDLADSTNLLKLLTALEKTEISGWIRCLYLHPAGMNDDLLRFFASSKIVIPYLDIPIQHIDHSILAAMRRGTTEKYIRKLIDRIKTIIPDVTLRTTILTGFPGETEQIFKKLKDFIEETQFDRLGIFVFSKEEGTFAYSLPNHIKKHMAQKRADEIMELQQKISYMKNISLIGKKLKVIIDGTVKGKIIGRLTTQAPEIDGCVYINDSHECVQGMIVNVRITDAFAYDLSGTL